MSYRVELSARAQQDLDGILTWLHSRSPEGAAAWLARWREVLRDLAENPGQFALAPENEDHPEEIWHVLFKTRRGKKYRAIYVIQDDFVAITYLRGPGQDTVPPDEF